MITTVVEFVIQLLVDLRSILYRQRDKELRSWARLHRDVGVVPTQAMYCRPGPELRDQVLKNLPGRVVLNIVGEPGVGKTFTIRECLSILLKEGKICGFAVFTPTGSATPDELFVDSTVFAIEGGQQRVCMQASFFGEIMDRIAAASGQSDKAFICFIDEVTRAPGALINALLEPLASSEYLLRGKKVKLNISYIFAANPPGLDATSLRLPPAFCSRVFETIRVIGTETGLLSGLYVPLALAKQQVEFGRDPQRVDEEQRQELTRLCCVVRLLLNGLPFTRNCWADVTPQERRLVQRILQAAPSLAGDLLIVGKHSAWGPDARRPMSWMMALTARAVGEAGIPTTSEFIESAIPVNLHAMRITYNDARDSQARETIQGAIYRIAKRVSLADVRKIIMEHEDAYSLAQKALQISTRNPATWSDPCKASLDQLSTVFYRLRDRLEDCCGPDVADQRWRGFSKVVRESIHVKTGELTAAQQLRKLAREEKWLDETGRLSSRIEVMALRDVCQVEGIPHALREFAATLCGTTSDLIFVSPEGWLRDELQQIDLADDTADLMGPWEYAPEFHRWVTIRYTQISHKLISTAVAVTNDVMNDRSEKTMEKLGSLSEDERQEVLLLLQAIKYRSKPAIRTLFEPLLKKLQANQVEQTCPVCGVRPAVSSLAEKCGHHAI